MKSFTFTLAVCLAVLPLPSLAQHPRIVGGGPAVPGAFPWMTALLDKAEPDTFTAQTCGGALIHPRWVLTAAHCVEGVKAADLQVVVGAADLSAAGLTRINVLEIIVHPAYFSLGYDYDLALLLLETPVTAGAPLELIDDPVLADTGVLATVLGWGTLSELDEIGTPILQSVELPIMDQTLANQYLGGDLTPNMLAAGLEGGGKDTCSGDSGGPLVVRGRQGQWVQAGIVSWGNGCGEPMSPGVYTRVSKFRQWIQSYVWPNFNAWEVAAGIGNDDGPDRDGDGLIQWHEYALRRNPLLADNLFGFPVAGRAVSPGHIFPTLTLRRPAGGGDVAWGLQHSDDLSEWSPLNPAAQQVGLPSAVPGDAGAEEITWRGTDGTPSSFLRATHKPATEYVNSRRPLQFPGGVTHALHSLDTLAGGFRVRDYLLTGLPAAGAVTLTLRADAFDPVLHIVNAGTGAVLFSSTTNTGSGKDEKIVFTPVAGTNYAARVTTQVAGTTGGFTLAVFQIPAGLLTIVAPQTRSGTLAITDATDPFFPDTTYYKDDFLFSPTTAAAVSFFETSAAFNPGFSLINAETGQLILAANGMRSFPRVGGGTVAGSAVQSFVPRPGVSYLLRGSSYNANAIGAYTVRAAATTTISPGGSSNGILAITDGIDSYYAPDYDVYVDDYSLTGAAPGIVRSISVTSTILDTTLEIIDAGTGYSVAFNDDEDELTTDSFLAFTPVAGHDYIIRVAQYFEDSDVGAYTLTVQ